ncbi:MAG TPA: metallophosphoesterase family protein [Thermoanaerobaculia bacterium]|nr:metallophosphoesterase family protein [Thermoanaerobaculia bacterium]
MIIALLSDLHANLEAVQACLRHSTERGAERFAFLGDLVGYGADPEAVVDIVADHVARGAIVVQGNHDAAVTNGAGGLNDAAAESLEWTRDALSPSRRAFLASLPLIVRENDICFVHATADAPERWAYIETNGAARQSIEAAGTTYTFGGHVHQQVLYFHTRTGKVAPFHPIAASPVPVPSHRRWHAIVGSVGQPRDGNPAAAYALFDTASEEMTFFRVAYDHIATAAKIRRASLPEWLAARLENGI